jgi:hypothetical protein
MIEPFTLVSIAILVHTILKLWIAANRAGKSPKTAGPALELVLSTPLSVEEILRANCWV